MKILVLEDNVRLAKLIKQALKKEAYEVDNFYNGEDALGAIGNGYSCFILDINVPGMDGISVLEYIRINHKQIPCMIISSNHDLEHIQKSYEYGCDDYIKKPFFIFELIQKINKLCVNTKSMLILNKEYQYDYSKKVLLYKEEEVELTKKEILFLELFASNLHHIATYSEIEEYVWEGESTNLTNIRALIKRLRKKIPYESITIVKGYGYSLNKSVEIV